MACLLSSTRRVQRSVAGNSQPAIIPVLSLVTTAKSAALVKHLVKFAVLTQGVLCPVISLVHHVWRLVHGTANTREIAACRARHHVLGFHATSVAPGNCLAHTNAPASAARNVPKAIVRFAQIRGTPAWISSR